ncbi:MAG: M28 family peptidase [Candidatus Baltobacteraceae bacterium]
MKPFQDAKALVFLIALLALAGCANGALPAGSTGGAQNATVLQSDLSIATAPSGPVCEKRVNDTPAKLLECIREQALFAHLVDLQHIADRNPGPDGHGNRDTGQPGYKASVDYVAALMRKAAYRVTIQQYNVAGFSVIGTPEFRTIAHEYAVGADWYVARLSGRGAPTARVEPVGKVVSNAAVESGAGCSSADFAGFASGNIALIQRGGCTLDTKVAGAQAAGAAGVIFFNYDGAFDQADTRGTRQQGEAFQAHLQTAARIPVVGVASYAVGSELYRAYVAGRVPTVHLDIQTRLDASTVDYNLIADSPYGDPNHVVVVDAHLDSIYGAGILDNGSGSSTILEVALKMGKTPTHNHLRYIWFGVEEIGLLGSAYYTKHLTPAELHRIAFDIDSDVTASPNYDILVADPKFARNVNHFPSNVVPESRRGNAYFFDYFPANRLPVRNASFGNDGTDSNSFSLAGIPDTGILTQQDCCKSEKEVDIWGGFRGNYEGDIPSFDGGCVDNPHRWCDNLTNISPYVLEFVSKGFAYVTFKLANDASIGRSWR